MPKDKISFSDLEYNWPKLSHMKARLSDKKWEQLFNFYTQNYTEVERNRDILTLSSRNKFDMGVEDTNENKELDDDEILTFKNKYPELFKDLTLDDFKIFYKTFIEVGEEELKKKSEESYTKIKAKYKDIPEEILMWADENTIITKTKLGYLIDDIEKTDLGIKKHSEFHFKTLINEKGELLAILDSEVENIGKGKARENLYFDPNDKNIYDGAEGYSYAEDMVYDTGVIEHSDYRAKTGYTQVGNTKIEYNFDEEFNPNLTKLTLNTDSVWETSFDIEYDENGKVKDIKLGKEDKNESNLKKTEVGYKRLDYEDVALDNETKSKIIDMLNNGKKFGFDYTLTADSGKVEITPIVVNKTNQKYVSVPQNVSDHYFKMLEDGSKQGIDFQLEYNKNGFRINYLTQTGAEGADFKRVEYSKNGKTKTTTTYDNNEVVQKIEQNGQLIGENRSSRNDAFLEVLLEKDYDKMKEILGYTINPESDFDFYGACKKYQDITGKNLMEQLIKDYENGDTDFKPWKLFFGGSDAVGADIDFEPTKAKQEILETYNKKLNEFDEIKNFKIEDSKIKELIMQSSHTDISENEYKETIGNKTYTVKIKDKKITISDGNKTLDIDLKGQPIVLKRILSEQNAKVLYQIAKKGMKLNWYDAKNPKPIEGIHYIGTVNIASYSTVTNEMNMEAENVSTKLISRSISHETGHSFWNSNEYPMNEEFIQVFIEEFEAWQKSDEQFKEGSHAYCCTSPDEMFAECYSIIVTGHCQSEYTLSKHFSRTLAVVRKMIEAGD